MLIRTHVLKSFSNFLEVPQAKIFFLAMQRPVPCTSGDSVGASGRGAHGHKVFPAFVVPLERWLSRDRLLSQRAFPEKDDPVKWRGN